MEKIILGLIIATTFISCDVNTEKEYKYKVIDADYVIWINGMSKYNIDIEIEEEHSEEEIFEIAKIIKSTYAANSYFIFFKLKGDMYANCHYSENKWKNPYITALTKKDIIKINKTKQQGTVLNSWLDVEPIVGGVISLVKEGDTLKMVTVTANYGTMTEIIKEVKQGNKIKYTFDTTHGDYYLVHADGSLNMYDNDGWHRKCEKINKK